MTIQYLLDRYFRTGRHQTLACLAILLSHLLLFACDGSDTRSTAKSAISGTYEIQTRIIAPVDGSTIVFVGGTSNVTFTSSVSGGTEPLGYTWKTEGPTTTNNATGSSPTITFLELGDHKVTLTATDSIGLTGLDSITITIAIDESGVSATTTTTSTTSTTTTTTTTTTT